MKKYDSLPLADTNTVAVDKELETRLSDSAEDGAMDWKAMCSPDKKTSATEKRWVYNNVLRQHEEGKSETRIIEYSAN